MHELLHSLEHSLLDSIKLLPFLFLAFLIIELIEHKLSNKTKKIISKSGKLGPILGSLLGLIPQCGFSVVATNLYITRIVSLGTLISIYLSTSDEMLIILLSKNAPISTILPLLLVKFIIGMLSGFVIDFIFRNKNKKKETYSICKEEHCGCEHEENLFKSSLIHTIKTFIFIFIATFIITYVFESNKNIKENLSILGLVYGIGVITGIIISIISYII